MNDDVMVISLKKAIDIFLLEKQGTCRSVTVDAYRNRLNFFLTWISNEKNLKIDEIMMCDVTSQDLKMYNVYLANKKAFENHPLKNGSNRKLSSTTRHAYTNDLKIFLRFCYDEKFSNFNLADKFKLVRMDNKEILPLYQDEVDKIDGCFNLKTETGLRNWCIIHCMLDMGLRRKEVIELRIQDVNFVKNFVHIEDGKGRERYVFLPNRVKSNLYRYLEFYRKSTDQHAYFFKSIKYDDQLTKDTISNLFARLKNKSEVSRLHPHLLRHTFASAFVLAGGDIRILQVVMGHSTISVTEKYVHVTANYKFLNDDVYRLEPGFVKRYY